MRTLLPRLAVAALTVGAATSALAADGVRAAVHDLWIGHLLAAVLVAMLAAGLRDSLAWAGMLLVATLAYAIGRSAAAVPAEALQQFGSFYPFHLRATALLLPITAVAAFFAARTAAQGPQARR